MNINGTNWRPNMDEYNKSNKYNVENRKVEKIELPSKSQEKRIKSQKAIAAKPASKEEGAVLSIVNDNAPVSMKVISQKARISMSKCAILINNLIKSKLLDKQDVIDAPK